MNQVFLFAAHNTVFALLLALVVAGVTRVWRNPAVAHLLWLLVLIRLEHKLTKRDAFILLGGYVFYVGMKGAGMF